MQNLVTRLEHSSFGQRQTLVAETARDASKEDLAAITRLLGHDSETVRIGAIEIVEAAAFHPALRHLSAVTVQRQGQERAFAARAVASLARPDDRALLEPVVRTWLQKNDPYLEIHANNLCARLGIVVSEDRAPRIEKPAAGPVAGITSPDTAARKQAIARTVSGLDNPAAALVDGLFDTRSPGVRLDLVQALAGLDVARIVPVLPRIMKKGDGDMLALVARALEPRMDAVSEAHVADVRGALEYGRGRVFENAMAREAIDKCLARLRQG